MFFFLKSDLNKSINNISLISFILGTVGRGKKTAVICNLMEVEDNV